jgi:hypothetical protein
MGLLVIVNSYRARKYLPTTVWEDVLRIHHADHASVMHSFLKFRLNIQYDMAEL